MDDKPKRTCWVVESTIDSLHVFTWNMMDVPNLVNSRARLRLAVPKPFQLVNKTQPVIVAPAIVAITSFSRDNKRIRRFLPCGILPFSDSFDRQEATDCVVASPTCQVAISTQQQQHYLYCL